LRGELDVTSDVETNGDPRLRVDVSICSAAR
jgi:hypothetical protein